MTKFVRASLTLPQELLEELDDLIKLEGYVSRSEAVRDAVHDFIAEHRWRSDLKGKQLGVAVIVYDHKIRGIGDRITDIQHHSKAVVGSVQHWHLDERNCMETIMISGQSEAIKDLLNRIESLRGVKQVKLVTFKK